MNQKNLFRILIAICLLGNTLTTNAQQMKDGFVKIFNGKSMAGWDADTTFWKVKDNSFVGEVTPQTPIKTNTFLIYRESLPADFELKAKYRISVDGNSGINYRSEELPTIKYALKGYQADIDGGNVYTGQNYEEGNADSLKAKIKTNDWNDIHIIVKGNHMQHYINGVLMSEVTDEDPEKRKMSGLLGFQVHISKTMKVEYRKVFLKEL
ncbi:MAG: DUF1080 domain-containing protein [Chitinophagia bacterium]|nr:DUF1080 domain-containing protein [Chitinophagia bacterium]